MAFSWLVALECDQGVSIYFIIRLLRIAFVDKFSDNTVKQFLRPHRRMRVSCCMRILCAVFNLNAHQLLHAIFDAYRYIVQNQQLLSNVPIDMI